MAHYEKSEVLSAMAASVIKDFEDLNHLDSPDCRIAYQVSDQKKTRGDKTIYADCEKIKDKYKAYMPYDFIITFYLPNCSGLSEEAMARLMYHELKHVGFDPKDDIYRINPHNLEDFRECIEKWGVDWIES